MNMNYILLQNKFLLNKSHTISCTSKVTDKPLSYTYHKELWTNIYINHD